MLCRASTTFKWTANLAPPNTVPLIPRCWRTILFGSYEAIQKHSNLWLGRAPPNTAHFFSKCWKIFSSGCYAAMWKHSSLWLGCAPQHLLSRPSSFRGVEESFRFDVMQTFNNIQMNGWSCSPKHGPRHFTLLKKFFVWMVWNFSKTLKSLAEPCSPKHGPVLFTVLKNHFIWMLCRYLNTFKFIAGPRSPKSVTSKLISRRWKIVSSWCYEEFQQRWNEPMVVLPQTRSNAMRDVEKIFRFDSMKFSKTLELIFSQCSRTISCGCYAARYKHSRIISFWYCADNQQRSNEWMFLLPQTRCNSFHGVEDSFRLDGKKLFQNIWTYCWTVLFQTRPCSIHGVEKTF